MGHVLINQCLRSRSISCDGFSSIPTQNCNEKSLRMNYKTLKNFLLNLVT